MNNQFDWLAKGLAQSITRILLYLVIAAHFAGLAWAKDLYVDAAAGPSGDGSAATPYWRITDAVVRARHDRPDAVIPASERIIIHVAAGTYHGRYDAPRVAAQPQ